jgi:multicomponent Na+:H+ antiporter subunit C
MSGAALFTVAGSVLVALGLRALILRAHLFWKVLGANVMANGVFLVLVAGSLDGAPAAPGVASAAGAAAGIAGATGADPVPQAMVLTGIVVAVSATALALGLALRVKSQTGRPSLPEERGEA